MSLWRMIFQLDSLGDVSYSNILRLAELRFTFAVANAKPETGFSHMKRMGNPIIDHAYQREIFRPSCELVWMVKNVSNTTQLKQLMRS